MASIGGQYVTPNPVQSSKFQEFAASRHHSRKRKRIGPVFRELSSAIQDSSMNAFARFRCLMPQQHGRTHRALVEHVEDCLRRSELPDQWLLSD